MTVLSHRFLGYWRIASGRQGIVQCWNRANKRFQSSPSNICSLKPSNVCGYFIPVYRKHNSIPTSSLSSLHYCWVSHFAFRPATRHRLSRHPPPWRGKMSVYQRCQSTDSLHISNTNHRRQNKKTSNSPRNSQLPTKFPKTKQKSLGFTRLVAVCHQKKSRSFSP